MKNQQAISKRNDILASAETRMRALMEEIKQSLGKANGAVFTADSYENPTATAEATTRAQVFQLLQDRLQEVHFGTVHRY